MVTTKIMYFILNNIDYRINKEILKNNFII